MPSFAKPQESITRGLADLSGSCLDGRTGSTFSLPSDYNSWCRPLKSVLPLLCSFPLACMGGKVTQIYKVQTGEIVNIMRCAYWKLCNSTWEGIACSGIKFNYLQPKVVNIEWFKDQFPFFFSLLLLPK